MANEQWGTNVVEILIPRCLDGRALGSLCPVIGDNPPSVVTFNFSRLATVRPSGIAYVANLANYLTHLDVKVMYSGLDNASAAMAYLDDAGFFSRELGKPLRKDATVRSTTYPLEDVQRQRARGWLETDFMQWLAGQTGYTSGELSNVASGLEELLNNVVDHTTFDIGSVYAEHHPDESQVTVSIADIGAGIPHNVRRVHPELSDGHAICRATEYGFSTNASPNRGVGLNHILSNVVGLNSGSAVIRSGGGCVVFEQLGDTFTTRMQNVTGSCIGTMIELNIPTDRLEWIGGNDDEEALEW